ncbi:hypothetical protein JTB14_036320 [Gonioctena quinquepunctata]|nr:hypothetical protein JTB14_036320 [Gonioctena quinquepunctata]
MIKRQTGNNIKIVRSDNGTEYVNHSFKDHFKKEGIIHETSAPYTPEQNEAFVLVPKHQRHKFDRKSTKQYLVGYDGYSRTTEYMETNSRKVSVARDVNFNEGVFMKQSPVPNYMSFEIDMFGNENYDCVQINKDECEVSENEVHDQLAPDSDFETIIRINIS